MTTEEQRQKNTEKCRRYRIKNREKYQAYRRDYAARKKEDVKKRNTNQDGV